MAQFLLIVWLCLQPLTLHALDVHQLKEHNCSENCHGDQRVRCKDQRIIEHANTELLYNTLGKIEHCG